MADRRVPREALTAEQQALLWLLREYGDAVVVRGTMLFSWAPRSGGGVDIASAYARTLRANIRPYIEIMVGEGVSIWRLTPAGGAVAAAMMQAPETVAPCRRPQGLYWLTDDQWRRVKPILESGTARGASDNRILLSGIVHVLRTGIAWADAPAAYGTSQVLRDWLARWCRRGVLDEALAQLLEWRSGAWRLIVSSRIIWGHTALTRHAARGAFPILTTF